MSGVWWTCFTHIDGACSFLNVSPITLHLTITCPIISLRARRKCNFLYFLSNWGKLGINWKVFKRRCKIWMKMELLIWNSFSLAPRMGALREMSLLAISKGCSWLCKGAARACAFRCVRAYEVEEHRRGLVLRDLHRRLVAVHHRVPTHCSMK